jgi:hypothetical protein
MGKTSVGSKCLGGIKCVARNYAAWREPRSSRSRPYNVTHLCAILSAVNSAAMRSRDEFA